MDAPGGTDVRCSTIVFRDDALLLVHRVREDADDWTLPGGTPRPGESMAACARRETLEETGLTVAPTRVAFVLEANRPGSARRTVDLVFLAGPPPRGEPEPQEPDLEARFVALGLLSELSMRPPLAGYLRALNASGAERTAAYLGNMWRPARNNEEAALLHIREGRHELPGMCHNNANSIYGPGCHRLLCLLRCGDLPRPCEIRRAARAANWCDPASSHRRCAPGRVHRLLRPT
jgi:ADP-ribose pyrophosphatase YjhB (NUDIX family)